MAKILIKKYVMKICAILDNFVSGEGLRGPPPSGPIFAILRDSFIIFSDMLQTDPKRSKKNQKNLSFISDP